MLTRGFQLETPTTELYMATRKMYGLIIAVFTMYTSNDLVGPKETHYDNEVSIGFVRCTLMMYVACSH